MELPIDDIDDMEEDMPPPAAPAAQPPPAASNGGRVVTFGGVTHADDDLALPIEDVDDADPSMSLPIDDIDDAEPEPDAALHIEGIDDDDDMPPPPDDADGAAAEDAIDGDEGAAASSSSAAAAKKQPAVMAPPKALKIWPLPPSLTPKKRGASRHEVELDLDVQPAADGAWRCHACDAAYEARIGLYAHARFCVGRAAAWHCEWCACSELETNHKATGPNGIKTLCSACGQRYRHGAAGMPQQNDKGEWVCEHCQRGFPSMSALGGHRRFCDGGVWRCQWCDCKYEDANGKGPGPGGAMTLCSVCANRFRAGHTAPPAQNADGKFECESCHRVFDTIMGLGSHRKRCDGGKWECDWCKCKADEGYGKSPGPRGKGTLCTVCSARWKSGHTGPPDKDVNGR